LHLRPFAVHVLRKRDQPIVAAAGDGDDHQNNECEHGQNSASDAKFFHKFFFLKKYHGAKGGPITNGRAVCSGEDARQTSPNFERVLRP